MVLNIKAVEWATSASTTYNLVTKFISGHITEDATWRGAAVPRLHPEAGGGDKDLNTCFFISKTEMKAEWEDKAEALTHFDLTCNTTSKWLLSVSHSQDVSCHGGFKCFMLKKLRLKTGSWSGKGKSLHLKQNAPDVSLPIHSVHVVSNRRDSRCNNQFIMEGSKWVNALTSSTLVHFNRQTHTDMLLTKSECKMGWEEGVRVHSAVVEHCSHSLHSAKKRVLWSCVAHGGGCTKTSHTCQW